MPRATVWIRNEDWKQWQAIDKKAEWLHEHLNQPQFGKLSDLGELQEFELTQDASSFATPSTNYVPSKPYVQRLSDNPKYEPPQPNYERFEESA